jgi:hypothetical protein
LSVVGWQGGGGMGGGGEGWGGGTSSSWDCSGQLVGHSESLSDESVGDSGCRQTHHH